MSALEVAADHARSRSALAERIRSEVRDAWAAVDPARISQSWLTQIPRLLLLLTSAQRSAAAAADGYLDEVLRSQGVDPAAAGAVGVDAFAGVASDGRRLESLLTQPAITVKAAVGQGVPVERAMVAGDFLAGLVGHTQVADAGRVADQVAMVARPRAAGQVRMVVGKTCSRCLVLAGRWYRWNAGFNRHPKCDCVGIPGREDTVGDLRTDPRAAFDAMGAAEQDRVFGKSGAQAIRDGADIAAVVNARRGLYTAGGRLFTGEAAGARPRLMPEQIFRDARDRDDAIRLLRLHGYIS